MKPTKTCASCKIEQDGSVYRLVTSKEGYVYYFPYCRPCEAAKKRAIRKAAAAIREVPLQEVVTPRKIRNIGHLFKDKCASVPKVKPIKMDHSKLIPGLMNLSLESKTSA